MSNLTGDAYDHVTSIVRPKEETYTKVMTTLKEEFGEDKLERSIKVTAAIDSFKRSSGEALDDFLKRYVQLRSKAMMEGWRPSKRTEGATLLSRADLGEAANLALLNQLESKKLRPTYEAVRSELKVMSTAQKIPGSSTSSGGAKKRGADESALVGEVKRMRREIAELQAQPMLASVPEGKSQE